MEVNPTNATKTVKNAPKIIFNHLFMEGFSMSDKQTINAGIAKSADAANSLVGLSNIFTPLTSPSTFLGTYNSK